MSQRTSSLRQEHVSAECACCEPWVVEERRRFQEATQLRRARLEALGLCVIERQTLEEISRIAAWDRMLRAAA